jgi:segregation and condensation protein B
MDKSDLFTSEVKGLRQSLQDLTTRFGHAVDKQENMEKQLAEQSRWSQEAKEELERQIAIVSYVAKLPREHTDSAQIETQQNLLLAEEQPSFARSTKSEDEAASEGEEEEVEDENEDEDEDEEGGEEGEEEGEEEEEEDDDFDSGPEYEEPDDRTFRPESLSENGDSRDGEDDEGSESEEYEQFAEAEQTPCPTRAGRKRRAKAQNPSPHPSKKRPAWVRRETAVPNPHLATIARDLERRRSGVRGWMGRGTGIRSDPVVVD